MTSNTIGLFGITAGQLLREIEKSTDIKLVIDNALAILTHDPYLVKEVGRAIGNVYHQLETFTEELFIEFIASGLTIAHIEVLNIFQNFDKFTINYDELIRLSTDDSLIQFIRRLRAEYILVHLRDSTESHLINLAIEDIEPTEEIFPNLLHARYLLIQLKLSTNKVNQHIRFVLNSNLPNPVLKSLIMQTNYWGIDVELIQLFYEAVMQLSKVDQSEFLAFWLDFKPGFIIDNSDAIKLWLTETMRDIQ